jgi:RNA polymerase sigma-70 factor (ECF subfamily)
VVDGEDIVQEALAKAYYLLPTMRPISNLRAWLFRIAHNKAIDYLRSYDRRYGEPLDEYYDVAGEGAPLDTTELGQVALSHYMKLTALQRSCVVLKDVMEYSLAEISEVLDMSVPAIKAALNRGRAALRERAEAAREGQLAPMDPEESRMLAVYVEHFNARDFDTLRDLLVDDAKLELVGRTNVRGASGVGDYFSNYDRLTDWRMEAGRVDGRPAVLGYERICVTADADPEPKPRPRPAFFVLIGWRDGRISSIRDYRYARHVAELARFDSAV